ncbi:hypothetical protein [Streptomyces sp. CC210A]|nr:hypothetical protein [Streptomyces sp. CC210A]
MSAASRSRAARPGSPHTGRTVHDPRRDYGDRRKPITIQLDF